MLFPFGEDVQRDRRPMVQDPYNPAGLVQGSWDDAESVTIPGAWVASSSSAGTADATRTQVLESKSLYCAPDDDVQVGDRIRAAGGTYYVNALPEADVNPFTDWQPVREVPLDRSLG
jgi:hypothetical protein